MPTATNNRIAGHADIARGMAVLTRKDPRLTTVARQTGPVPLRLQQKGFAGLAQIVVSQHISKAAAAAVFNRLAEMVRPLSAANVLSIDQSALVNAGLTRNKQKTLKSIADALVNEHLDLDAVCDWPVDKATQQLTSINGIGRWTAEVYLLLCAGHADIFPAGDRALQSSVREGLAFQNSLTEKQLREIAKAWSPWRSVASRLFWAYHAKNATRA